MSQAIQVVVNLPQATLGMRKICLRSGLRLLQDMGAVEEDDYAETLAEIKALKPAVVPDPFAGLDDDDDDGKGGKE